MLIFAIISIPSLYVILNKKFYSKNIFLFFWGIVISSIISLLMWALGSLYQSNSDLILNKSIKLLIVNIIPLMVIFIYSTLGMFHKTFFKKLDISFLLGYLYWNLLFLMLLDKHITYSFSVILIPILYSLISIMLNQFESLTFKKNDLFNKSIVFLLIPFVFLISQVLLLTSIWFLFLFELIVLAFVLLIKYDIKNLKSKIFV